IHIYWHITPSLFELCVNIFVMIGSEKSRNLQESRYNTCKHLSKRLYFVLIQTITEQPSLGQVVHTRKNQVPNDEKRE
ncbi:hypothetical protein QUF76_12200, partial [Desulfobacterales bacterium HSG16]|nr:hypothetical protein [Desulfobacterales bacterium HSG16]